MRITYITAGAGGMYCGSCLRDNALAAALHAQGHEVLLVPTYTPPLTDELSVSEKRVFFGGVSVYLEQHVRLFRRTPWLLDRLWDGAWLLRLVSGRGVTTTPSSLGDLAVSVLRGEDGFQRKEILKLVHWLRRQPRPDTIDLSNSMLIALARPLKSALRVPICCTLQGESIFLDGLEEPHRTRALDLIRENVSHVDGFIAVSDYYADFMTRYLGIPERKMHVAPLGVTIADLVPGPRGEDRPFTVGFFGRVAPEKGVHRLAEAYCRLRQRGALEEARLELAGYLAPEHHSYLAGIERTVRDAGLGDELRYRGVLSRPQKVTFLQSLDVMAVPATYDDPKGLALLEAMACGVPVVQPRRGTYAELIERTGGGLLAEVDDDASLEECLLRLYTDRALARELGDRGAAGVRSHFTAARMAEKVAGIYAAVAAEHEC